MTTRPKALVLAAGKSTRISSISQGRPKPLIEIAGETIISRNLRWLAAEGIETVFINLHYKPDDIRDFVGDGSRFGLHVSYALEPEILGTAGAAKALQAHFAETFLVVYGDNLIDTSITDFLAAHRDSNADATVATFDRTRHPHTGIAGGRVRIDASNRIIDFKEGADDTISPLVNAGVYALEPQVLDTIPENTFFDFAKDVFPAMLDARQKIMSAPITGYCLGLDTPESFARAGDLISNRKIQLR